MAGKAPYPGTLFGEVLVTLGYAKQSQVDEALAEQQPGGRKLGEILVDKGYCTKKETDDAFEVQKGLREQIDKQVEGGQKPAPEAVAKMTIEIAKEHGFPVVEAKPSAMERWMKEEIDALLENSCAGGVKRQQDEVAEKLYRG